MFSNFLNHEIRPGSPFFLLCSEGDPIHPVSSSLQAADPDTLKTVTFVAANGSSYVRDLR